MHKEDHQNYSGMHIGPLKATSSSNFGYENNVTVNTHNSKVRLHTKNEQRDQGDMQPSNENPKTWNKKPAIQDNGLANKKQQNNLVRVKEQ